MRYLLAAAAFFWTLACAAPAPVELPYAATANTHSARYRFSAYYASLYRLRQLASGELVGIDNFGMLIRGTADGRKWTRSWTSDIDGNDFAISADGQSLWLAGERGQVRYSANGGRDWEALATGTTEDLLAIALAADERTLFVAGKNGTLLRSSDRGRQWEKIDTASGNNWINGIYLSPDGNTVFVVGSGGMVRWGDSRGRALTAHYQCGYRNLRRIEGAPDGRRLVAVGVTGTICVSNDGGKAWSRSRLTGPQYDLWTAVFDPKTNRFFLAGESGYIFAEKEEGWDPIYLDWLSDNLYNLVVGPDGALVAAGAGGAIVRSIDSGKNWKTIGDTGRENNAFYDLASTRDGTLVIAVKPDGSVLLSTDGGRHFASDLLAGMEPTVVAVAPSGRVAYVGTSTGELFRWERHRATWTRVGVTVPGNITAMRTNLDGTIAVMTTLDGGIWALSEDGAHLRQTFTPQSDISLHALVADEPGRRFIAAGTDGAVLISDDEGASWTMSNLGSKETVLTLAWERDGTVWAGTEGSGIQMARQAAGPWVQRHFTSAAIRSIAVLDGVVWWAEESRVSASYDRLLSRMSARSFVGSVYGMVAAPGTHSVWISTRAHELGAFRPTGKAYPELLRSSVPRVLSSSETNKATLTFSHSDMCAIGDLKLTGFISRGGGVQEKLAISSALLPPALAGTDTVEASFDLPDGLAPTGLTLRIHATCGPWGYMYSFYDRALMSLVDQVPGGYATIVAVVAALVLPLVSLVLYAVRPVLLLRELAFLKSDLVPGFLKPVAGLIAYYLLAQLLCKRPRVLEAWIRENKPRFENQWESHPTVRASRAYLPLPIEFSANLGKPERMELPSASLVAPLVAHLPLHVKILGAAGMGKTTLACTLGQWLLDGSLLKRPAFPVLLGGGTGGSAPQAFSTALEQMLGQAAPDPELAAVLLSHGYLVPIIDRLSERNTEFQDTIEPWSPKVGLLIITTRKNCSLPYRSLEIYPSPIASVSVLSRYIEHEIALRYQVAGAEALRDTADIVRLLVHTIAANGRSGAEARLSQQITPLLASTFAALAVELLQEGEELDSLPSTTAQVYMDYMRRLLKQTPVKGPVLAACAELAQCSVALGNGPKALLVETAASLLGRHVGVENSDALLEHLVAVGILHRLTSVRASRVSFVIDSFAEVLAAHFIIEGGPEAARLQEKLRDRVRAGTAPSAAQTLEYITQLLQLSAPASA